MGGQSGGRGDAPKTSGGRGSTDAPRTIGGRGDLPTKGGGRVPQSGEVEPVDKRGGGETGGRSGGR